MSRSSETLVTSAHSFVSASTKPSEDPAALSSLKQRIRQLEESLERAESEADQAKIKLNAHILQNPPIPKAPIADKVQPLTKKTSTKRKPGTAGDQEPGNSNAPMKRRKKGGGAPAAPVLHPSPLSTSPPGTSLKRILEELGTGGVSLFDSIITSRLMLCPQIYDYHQYRLRLGLWQQSKNYSRLSNPLLGLLRLLLIISIEHI